ncbi:hypothetical protein Ciccas_009840, partial [Cichlidogyrus casuarinus]
MEKKLVRDLFQDYDKRVRPVDDRVSTNIFYNNEMYYNQHQILCEFGIELNQILDLNEMDQVLTTSIRSRYRWTDHHLKWNPTEYAGLTSVHLPANNIWNPDIYLYN